MNDFISNPEFLRNARIQLRPGRAIAALVICAAVSLTVWYSYENGIRVGAAAEQSIGMFKFVLMLQIVVLLIGGGIYELLSVHREKELNTFDYQRVTRLTTFELGLGKLFGAPILMYLIVLCLMPIALLGAFQGLIDFKLVAEAYFILFAGCIAFHVLALLISMALGRGVSAIAILPFLILVAFTSVDLAGAVSNWMFHQLNPFAAIAIIESNTRPAPEDLFFGFSASHFIVLMAIFITFTAWFLLAIVRNLKRDPAVYELYSPAQAFGFAMFLEFLIIGFFNWKSPIGAPIVFNNQVVGYNALPALDIEKGLMGWSFWVFVLLGLILLRNRERIRRRIRTMGESAASLWAALWPAPSLVAGVIVVGIAVVELIQVYRKPAPGEWSWGLATLNIAFLALWVARDLLYLQWMGLRRSRRPLVAAVLYLIVFYICVSVALGVAHTFVRPNFAPFSAALIPSNVSWLDISGWMAHSPLWILALVLLAAQVVLFALLQWQKLREFVSPVPVVPIAPASAPTPVTTGSLFPR
ncbi:MAG TPA: hypothetical protein VN875_03435 [Candidatus Binatus sp.]|nr:hypothetical protein [Candidatus Binatus sp.]